MLKSIIPVVCSESIKEGPMEHEHIHWLGHASFRIEDAGKQIYIDPWKVADSMPRADVILITHAHFDHYSPQDIEKLRQEGTVVLAPYDVAKSIKGARAVEPSQVYDVNGTRVFTIPAYNLGKKFHPKENKWVGYVVALSSGQRIYHAGDTDAIPEMRKVECDIAFLPSGGTYTMTASEAAAAANTFGPKAVIPMHWGDIVGSKEDAEEFGRRFKGETIVKVPERR
jgi:L-ascorbate metabolism protein UlaG (beta-lactamase superfamily)